MKARAAAALGDGPATPEVVAALSRLLTDDTAAVNNGNANPAQTVLGAAWATVIEVGRNQVAVVGATMNSLGNLAAMLTPLIVAYSVEWLGSWNVPLYLMGGLFLVGAACWAIVDPGRPVLDKS